MDRALKPCPEPACPNLVADRGRSDGRCGEHRGTGIYDHEWAAFARLWLRRHPWCKRCGARAVEVHHVVPVRAGGAKLDPRNLASMCVACHRDITPREFHVRRKSRYRPFGRPQ